MHRKNLFINYCSDWQTIETIGEGLPKLDVIPSLALVIKPVDSIDRSTLVVTTENEKVLRVLDLVCQKKTDRFQRLFASVDVIPKEQVIRLGRESSVLEQAEEIVILPMYITTDLQQTLDISVISSI